MALYPDSTLIVTKFKRQGIPGVLESCCRQIDLKTEGRPLSPSILTRFKWILTELLTNSVKHSEVPECLVTVEFRNNFLLIEKKDKGRPLTINSMDQKTRLIWPLTKHTGKVDITISNHGLDCLGVRTNDSQVATFYVEPSPDARPPENTSSLNEHFGLLIITKSCDRFTYEHDLKSGTNTFKTFQPLDMPPASADF